MGNHLIKAYTKVNLGDDLFVKILTERYKKEQFTLLIDKRYSKPFRKYKNLKLYEFNLLESVINSFEARSGRTLVFNKKRDKLLRKIDSFIHIGGSIFIENTNWRYELEKFKADVENSDNYFIIGANFGPFSSADYLNEYQKAFNSINDICFRDLYSYELFEAKNVRLAPDVVFSLDIESIGYDEKYKKTICISVIDLSWRDDLKVFAKDYEDLIIETIMELKKLNYNVLLFSFCKSQGDEKVISRIIKKCHIAKIDKYFYRGNLEEALTILKSSKAIISTRLHAFILSLVFNKPVFPFIYSNKTLNIIKDIEFDGQYLDIRNMGGLSKNDIITQLEGNYFNKLSDVFKESHNQFLELDKYIKNL